MKEKLILLHGALGSKTQFDFLITKLEESFSVYTLNFDGHGGDASSNEFSIQNFTQNVIDYMRINSIDDTIIFGYSMGGYVALSTALEIPEKIKKVITLGTKFEWDADTVNRELSLLDPIKIEEKVPMFAKKLDQIHCPNNWKEVMKKTTRMMTNMAKGAKLSDADFKKINLNVVVGIGSLDSMVSYEESEYVSELLPNSKLIKLDNVTHPIDKIRVDELVNYIVSN